MPRMHMGTRQRLASAGVPRNPADGACSTEATYFPGIRFVSSNMVMLAL